MSHLFLKLSFIKKTLLKFANISSFCSSHNLFLLPSLRPVSLVACCLWFPSLISPPGEWLLLLSSPVSPPGEQLFLRQDLIEYHIVFEAFAVSPRLGQKQKLLPHFEPNVLTYNYMFTCLSPNRLLLLSNTVRTNKIIVTQTIYIVLPIAYAMWKCFKYEVLFYFNVSCYHYNFIL